MYPVGGGARLPRSRCSEAALGRVRNHRNAAETLRDDPLAARLLAIGRERVASEPTGETALHSENRG